MAHPRRDPDHLTKSINIRLTDPEIARVTTAARRAGIPRAAYMRDVLLAASAPFKRRRLPRWLPE